MARDSETAMTRRQAITVTLGTVGAATLGGTTDAAGPPAPAKAKRKGDGERQHAWVVTDVEHDLFVPELALGPDDLGPKAAGCSMTKRVLQGGLRSGVDVVEVDNGLLRFVVVPTRGMGIWRAQCGDVRLGWDSPVRGPVHPAFVRLDEPDGLGWLAGFDEMLVRCGLEYNGGPEFHPSGILRYGLHGRIANTPAHKVTLAVDPATGALSVTGVVDEARLFGNKLRMVSTTSTRPGRAEIAIHDTIENLSDEPGELELIYHTNFGPPLVGRGATLVAPVKKMTPYDDVAAKDVPTWNVIGPEQPRAREICLLCELEAADDGQTGVMLRSPDGRQGCGLPIQRQATALFHVLEEPAEPRGRLRRGIRAGDEPPQHEDRRERTRPRHHARPAAVQDV